MCLTGRDVLELAGRYVDLATVIFSPAHDLSVERHAQAVP